MDWTEVPLDDKNGTVEWFFLWESTKVPDGNIVISAKAWDGISWSAPVNRLIDVNNGINGTAAASGDTTEGGGELSLLSIGIVALITIIIILGLIVMFVIIQRGNSRIKEYVPDGRIEPLEEVEAKLKPALVPKAAPEYAQLPVAVAVHGAAKPFSLLSAKPMHEVLPALPHTTETAKQVETNTARIKI